MRGAEGEEGAGSLDPYPWVAPFPPLRLPLAITHSQDPASLQSSRVLNWPNSGVKAPGAGAKDGQRAWKPSPQRSGTRSPEALGHGRGIKAGPCSCPRLWGGGWQGCRRNHIYSCHISTSSRCVRQPHCPADDSVQAQVDTSHWLFLPPTFGELWLPGACWGRSRHLLDPWVPQGGFCLLSPIEAMGSRVQQLTLPWVRISARSSSVSGDHPHLTGLKEWLSAVLLGFVLRLEFW